MAFDALKLAVPGVRGLQPYIPGKPIEELEREYGVTNVIKLASNENPLGPSPKALAAAQAALPGIARYPDGGGFALKRALAGTLSLLRDSGTRPAAMALQQLTAPVRETLGVEAAEIIAKAVRAARASP